MPLQEFIHLLKKRKYGVLFYKPQYCSKLSLHALTPEVFILKHSTGLRTAFKTDAMILRSRKQLVQEY
jgi:hypothetical protein